MSINKRFIEEADRLKRSNKNLSFSKMAVALGVSRQYFSQINTEKAKPSVDIVNKFAENLGADSVYILTGKRSSSAVPDINNSIENEIASLATIKMLSQRVAKLFAKLENKDINDVLDEMERETKILLRELV